jgi:hypothetical protein
MVINTYVDGELVAGAARAADEFIEYHVMSMGPWDGMQR